MTGRGVRTIKDADLQAVTPDAQTKTRFILVDAVGVTEGKKDVSQPLERKRSIAFDHLIDQIAQGRRDDDALSSLAARLAALERRLDEEDKARVVHATGGATIRALARGLLNAIDPDIQEATATIRHGREPTPEELQAIAEELTEAACRPFDDPKGGIGRVPRP